MAISLTFHEPCRDFELRKAPRLMQICPFSSLLHLERSPIRKFVQVLFRRNTQYKSPRGIRDDRKILLLACLLALEECLQLQQRRLHCDQLILLSFSLESNHCLIDIVGFADFLVFEKLLEVRNGDVAEERLVLGIDDGQMGVVAFIRGHESGGDGRGRRGGQRRWWIEVFYCRLFALLACGEFLLQELTDPSVFARIWRSAWPCC